MLDNRCSRGHKLYNMTLINKNRIMLKENRMAQTVNMEEYLKKFRKADNEEKEQVE